MNRWLGAVAASSLVATLWGLATFHDFAYFRHGDWDQYLSFFESQRRALAVYSEAPLWNPYHLGGVPGHAHPQFNWLSPFFLPILWFGTVPGTAVFFSLHAFAGFLGTYLLARSLRYSRSGSVLCAGVFLFCMAPFVLGGVVNRVNGSLVPWLALSFLKTVKQPRWIAGYALVIAVAILEGGFYALAGGGILIGCLCLLQGGFISILRAATLGLCGLLVGVGLAAVRLLPTIELYSYLPRQDSRYLGAPIWNPPALNTMTSALGGLLAAPVVGRRDFLFGQPLFVGIDLGIPLLALLVLAVMTSYRRWALWSVLLLFLLMVLGQSSALNLWSALQKVPGLSSFTLPMSFLFVLIIPLGLLLADALQLSTARILSRPSAMATARWGVVIAAVFAPLLLQQYRLLEGFEHPPIGAPAPAEEPFEMRTGDRTAMLPAVRAGRGVLFAYEEVIREPLEARWAEHGRPAGSDEDSFRGEWFFSSGENSGSSARMVEFTPGSRSFDVSCEVADRLLLNQNHFSGWRAQWDGRELEVTDEQGLLSVALPAGDARLVLRYEPATFRWGLGVSTLFALLAVALTTRRGSSILSGLRSNQHRETPAADAMTRCEQRLAPTALPPVAATLTPDGHD